jgi:serine/threonine protein kinase
MNICEFDGSVLRNLQQTRDPFRGRILRDRYRIIEKIGHGSMSDVYLAEQLQIGRKVLLKVLSIEYASNEAFVRRFRQEAKVISSLNHPQLVQLFDFDQTEDGQFFIVTEHVEGKRLKQILETEVIAIPRAVRFAVQIAQGLDAAHCAGVIHRDINPENILVVNDRDDIKITDFGFARSREAEATVRLTQVGAVLGNPSYITPEQIEGYESDERTDIYSLGIVLYEMLCGVVPFTAANPTAVWMKHLNDQPPPPTKLRSDIPRQLEEIVLRALQKKPEHRWAKMSELLAALNNADKELVRKPTAQNIPASIERTAGKASVQSPPRDGADKDDSPRSDTVSKTVIVENFDLESFRSESPESNLPSQNPISETMVLTQAIEAVHRQRKSWRWLGLAAALFLVTSLASWFAFFHKPPTTDQASSPSDTTAPTDGRSATQIVGVSLDIGKSELVVGERAGLRLTARYNDGSRRPIEETGEISWTSTNPAVAISDARGEIDAKRAGTTQFTARYMGLETPPIAITIRAPASTVLAEPKLVSLAIKGSRREVTARERLRLRVTGKYSDGRDKEIQSGVRWESSAPEIAMIDSTGTIVGQREGKVELIAHYGEIASNPITVLIKSPLTNKKSELRGTKADQSVKTAMVDERIKIARAHLDRGEYAEALNELGKARKIDPGNKDLQTTIADTQRACNAEKRLGRPDLTC